MDRIAAMQSFVRTIEKGSFATEPPMKALM